MNPDNLSFGTGSNLLGGSGALAQNMEQGAPALNQQSPASPGFTPGQQMNPYPPMPGPKAMAMQGILPAQVPQPPQGPPPPGMATPTAPKGEAQLIIEALSNRLKSMSELQHKMHDSANPQPPTGGQVG